MGASTKAVPIGKQLLRRGEIASILHLHEDKHKFCMISDYDPQHDEYEVLCWQQGGKYSIATKYLEAFDEKIIDELVTQNGFANASDHIKEAMKSSKEQVLDILNLFDVVKPIHFNAEENDLIGNSCPVVWGSTTLKPELLDPTGWYGRPNEQIITKAAKLGLDIQLAFTNRKNIPRIKKAVQQHNVHVLSLDVLKLLDCLSP